MMVVARNLLPKTPQSIARLASATDIPVADLRAAWRRIQDNLAALGDDFEPLPTGDALREHWLTTLPEGERRILGHLIDVYPAGITGDELSDLTEYKRSSRNTYIQRLRARQLVVTSGGLVQAADTLFGDDR